MRIWIVLMVAFFLAGFAYAQNGAVVRDTPHNLSVSNTAGTPRGLQAADGTLNNEICVYCHTPHGGSTTIPLWNRNQSGQAPSGYDKYTSTTMDATQPTNAAIIASVSGACLSCHDGTVAVDNLLNFNAAAHSPSETFTDLGGGATYGSAGTGTNNIMTGGIPFLGTDLRNDHPIAIDYSLARAAQTPAEFNNFTVTGSKVTVDDGAAPTLPLFSSTTNPTVECASCHNPHNNSLNGTNGKFLRASNAASDICYACHIK